MAHLETRAGVGRDEATLWRAVLARDAAWDGRFVYAVRTTGAFCRPTCPSRRPLRRNARFFASAGEAVRAGYRPCRRCRPEMPQAPAAARARILAVCRHLEARAGERVPLAELARAVGLSPAHLQRSFKRTVGVSPHRYADALRMGLLRNELRRGASIASASYGAGYGSSSRLYEAAASRLGMTPRAYRRRGAGEEIRYAVVPSPLGFLLVAATRRGVCSLRLGDSMRALETGLREEFGAAALAPARRELAAWLEPLVAYLAGRVAVPELPVDVRATAFEQRVWDAIRAIPYGQTATYGELAAALGRPRAARAVARACARNPVALLVPCHRVVPKGRGAGGYRWGTARKRRLLRLEQEQRPDR